MNSSSSIGVIGRVNGQHHFSGAGAKPPVNMSTVMLNNRPRLINASNVMIDRKSLVERELELIGLLQETRDVFLNSQDDKQAIGAGLDKLFGDVNRLRLSSPKD